MNLSLKITYEDQVFFRLEDITVYPITGSTQLYITAPGFQEILISAYSDFIEDINTDVLQITVSGTTNLPSGLYKIRYVSGTTEVCYRYLNNTQQLKKYAEAICSLYSQKCNMKIQDFEKSRNQLYIIGRQIRDAKYLCEDCGKTDIGMNIFREINEELEHFKPCYNGCSDC